MYTISKEFTFSAAHELSGVPDGHPCKRLHGHNYIVKLFFSNAVLNSIGFIIDYRELDPIKNWIDSKLDHRNLNDVFPFNPTAENIAEALFNTFKKLKPAFWQLSAIEVSETPKTNCRYEPNLK